ncbi:MAG: 4-hydroxy-tetrahydrodipicolinate synthase [Deltaproteobacteria bacterium]|nr:MAG: 4-hydroxy-tetrahydrodipicolinate synthase [Deltaproteobacteria bacterium]
MVKGAMVAIVTPFKKGKVDEKGLKKLIEFQIKNGTNAIIPCGTTGEAATLSHEEHMCVVEITVQTAAGRVPVVAGTGSNSTSESILLTKHAQKAGADAALLITPYYNKPTQEGLYQHFKAVAEEVDIPIVLYNVPGRTSVNMLPETVARLAEIKNIIGIKEATGSLQQISEVIRLSNKKFSLVSGDDFTVLPTLAVGGKGVISVVSNVAPKDMADLCNAFEARDRQKAQDLHYKLLPLCQAMFYETNPIPAKTALGLMGMISPELRLPLSPMSPKNVERLKAVLRDYGLIK